MGWMRISDSGNKKHVWNFDGQISCMAASWRDNKEVRISFKKETVNVCFEAPYGFSCAESSVSLKRVLSNLPWW